MTFMHWMAPRHPRGFSSAVKLVQAYEGLEQEAKRVDKQFQLEGRVPLSSNSHIME
jgi:hypothetical protein